MRRSRQSGRQAHRHRSCENDSPSAPSTRWRRPKCSGSSTKKSRMGVAVAEGGNQDAAARNVHGGQARAGSSMWPSSRNPHGYLCFQEKLPKVVNKPHSKCPSREGSSTVDGYSTTASTRHPKVSTRDIVGRAPHDHARECAADGRCRWKKRKSRNTSRPTNYHDGEADEGMAFRAHQHRWSTRECRPNLATEGELMEFAINSGQRTAKALIAAREAVSS